MNHPRLNSLFASLDNAVEILAEARTPDSVCTAAFDTLKQARAMIARAFASKGGAHATGETAFGDDAPALS
jgi:hypothetical protein